MSPSEASAQKQGSIKLSLVNSDLWKAFHSSGTEMLVTKHGRDEMTGDVTFRAPLLINTLLVCKKSSAN
ncbi:unnamed protein product [Arctogadus glacialis]